MTYNKRIEKASKKNKSNIVLALDYTIADPKLLLQRSLNTLKETAAFICAVKLNRQIVLPLGLKDGTEKIVNLAHELGLPAIMDCKINDVGHTNRSIAEHYFNLGFDAVTASPFVGWEEGIKPVFETAENKDGGVILLVYMSHKGSDEGYGQKVLDSKTGIAKMQYEIFAGKALNWGAAGVIVGATYPDKIRAVNKILKGRIPIYSPGLVIQGGNIIETVKAGSKYLIIGRAIFEAENPSKAAAEFKDAINKVLA